MERFLTRYVLPPLARTIQLEALAANQRALLLLRDGGDGLDAALAAGRACWWLLRPALPEGRWRSVRDSLAGQRALARRSPLPRRTRPAAASPCCECVKGGEGTPDRR